MKLLETQTVLGLADLYLASFDETGERRAEFVDTLEPGIPKSEKWVLMISTQLGCPVGCRICDAGSLGYRGNLNAEEMLGQVRFVFKQNPNLDPVSHPKIKIHFARMGEPSLNPAVLEALKSLAEEFPKSGILPSLSTVAPDSPAVQPFFWRLKEIKDSSFPKGKFQMQFSVHSTDEAQRREIVPIRSWGLSKIADFGRRFREPGDRKITLNFPISSDSIVDPEIIARQFSPEDFLVKITPVNPTKISEGNKTTFLWESPPERIFELSSQLRRSGFTTILSPSLDSEVAAKTSCGQLWSSRLEQDVQTALQNKEREASSYLTLKNIEEKIAAWEAALSVGARKPQPFHPEAAGLLVVDLQDFFLDPRSPAYRPQARAILGRTRELIEAFRGAGRPVIFVAHAVGPDDDPGLMGLWWKKVCSADGPWSKIPRFLASAQDPVFYKTRYSAFSNPKLEPALKSLDVKQLVVAGIMTNLCVESSVRDAFDLGFQTFVPLDATAAHSEELHLASLKNIAFGFSTVIKSAEISDALKAAVL